MLDQETKEEDINNYLLLADEAYKKEMYKDAFQWYEKAANLENPIAQYYMGLMYENGRGINQNKVKAFNWYKKSIHISKS